MPGQIFARQGAECTDCAVGSFSDKSGASFCKLADPGHFVGKTGGSSKQTECDKGRYTDTEGQSSCLPADPGTYVPKSGASESTPCAPGQYSGSPRARVSTAKLVATPKRKVRTPARLRTLDHLLVGRGRRSRSHVREGATFPERAPRNV